MKPDLTEINGVIEHSTCLLDEAGVERMFAQLAQDINEQFHDKNPLLLCVMTGAVVAMGMLLPRLKFPLEIDYIHATRYQGQLVGKELIWKQLPTTALTDRVVIVVDDVLDEGVTMAMIKAFCLKQGAESCHSVVLVDKDLQRDKPITADFIGYQAGNQYLYGLGMDYKGYLRNVNGLYACPENLQELLCQD